MSTAPESAAPELTEAAALVDKATLELAAAPSEVALRETYARYGGQKGAVKRVVTEAIARAGKDRKRVIGQEGNAILGAIEAAFAARLDGLGHEARARDLARSVDVTLPGRATSTRGPGHLHPVTLARREIEDIFRQLGFSIAAGPEVESDFYNFEALAFPHDHPARDMQDTFYVAAPAGPEAATDAGAETGEHAGARRDAERKVLLRTHTSPVQIRTMLAAPPPLRVICPGAVYRKDDDPTHSPMFHQVEGLLVDEEVSFADLKGVLLHFARAYFGEAMDVRLRPSFFPFTEPSAEVDITCVFCAGQGEILDELQPGDVESIGATLERLHPCAMCKRTGWMEVGGAGMVDPEVFRHVGYDSERYTGFAFGFGINRMAMLKYGIDDIKRLYDGDVRFLAQFPGLSSLSRGGRAGIFRSRCAVRVSVRWLEELAGLVAGAESIAARLTAAGLEVEGTTRVGGFSGVVVAEVRATRPHPQSDRLTLVDVYDGEATTQVVCGASNVPAPGGRVAWARPGARLPDGRTLEAREVRGVLSPGMLCAEDELGLGEGHDGILVLDHGFTPGADLAGFGLDDTILELNVTPNRPDCLGHIGVARELAALYGPTYRPGHAWDVDRRRSVARRFASVGSPWNDDAGAALPPSTCPPLGLDDSPLAGGGYAGELAQVGIEDPEGCARYIARVITGVRVAQSPLAVRLRLASLGVRPINNVVDATNLVLFETGHPLHAFDLDRLAGARIVVRRPRPGERLVTLDDKERELAADDVIIADAERPVAVAGVMGGRDAEVSASTTRVLLEAAHFAPARIRRTARRLGLHSEASHRFERGVDPNRVLEFASESCALQIARRAHGRVAVGCVDAYPRVVAPAEVRMRSSRVERVLGLRVEPAEQARLLSAIGVDLSFEEGGALLARVPTFRPDLTREIDLVEELARLSGYDAIPATLPRASTVAPAPHSGDSGRGLRREAARDALAGLGLSEAITYAFVSPHSIAALGYDAFSPEGFRARPLRVENPLREEQSALRTSLIPGLCAALRDNLSHGALRDGEDVRLFETGAIFFGRGPGGDAFTPAAHLPSHGLDVLLPEERTAVACVLAGRRAAWLKPGEEIDFFDAKGVACALLEALRVEGLSFRTARAGEAPWLHPGLGAAIVAGGDVPVGFVGELHPEARERFGLEARAFAVEIDLDALPPPAEVIYRGIARYPGSVRDLSFFVSREVPAARLVEVARGASALVESVRVLDDYREPGRVDDAQKGMLLSVAYRASDRTLTDEEINGEHARVLAAIRACATIETR